jgi:hypothetical protein
MSCATWYSRQLYDVNCLERKDFEKFKPVIFDYLENSIKFFRDRLDNHAKGLSDEKKELLKQQGFTEKQDIDDSIKEIDRLFNQSFDLKKKFAVIETNDDKKLWKVKKLLYAYADAMSDFDEENSYNFYPKYGIYKNLDEGNICYFRHFTPDKTFLTSAEQAYEFYMTGECFYEGIPLTPAGENPLHDLKVKVSLEEFFKAGPSLIRFG